LFAFRMKGRTTSYQFCTHKKRKETTNNLWLILGSNLYPSRIYCTTLTMVLFLKRSYLRMNERLSSKHNDSSEVLPASTWLLPVAPHNSAIGFGSI